MDNLSVVLHKAQDAHLEQRPIPVLTNPNDVLIRMEYVGICGSDVHQYEHGGLLGTKVVKPIIIGHEGSGTVVEVGANVTHLKPNDRVAIEPGHGCGDCQHCRKGQYNICRNFILYSSPPTDGLLTKYHIHPSAYCYKLPDHVTSEEGALVEPLTVAVHSCRKANISIGDTVLIFGAGPIGLASLLVAKAMGAHKVIIADIAANRLEKAKELGADVCIQTNPSKSERETVVEIKELLGDNLPNISLDCVGIGTTFRLCLKLTIPGGTITVTGLAQQSLEIPMMYATRHELRILGAFGYCNEFPIALKLVASGKVNIKALVTHRFSIEDFGKAIQTVRSANTDVIKVMIQISKNENAT